jgi:hypothetical protein
MRNAQHHPPNQSTGRAERIVDLPTWSWRRRSATFLAVAGGIWLFVEPIPAFLGSQAPLTPLGVWGYVAWLFSSALLTGATEGCHRRVAFSRISFIRLTIILERGGTRYLLEVPEDMQVGRFVDLFLKRVTRHASLDSFLPQSFMYSNTLVVHRAAAEIELSRDTTLRNAGLQTGDSCTLRGTIQPRYATLLYRDLPSYESIQGYTDSLPRRRGLDLQLRNLWSEAKAKAKEVIDGIMER